LRMIQMTPAPAQANHTSGSKVNRPNANIWPDR
jgi:hypothetical protein